MTKGERSNSVTSQENYSAVIIADIVAEVPISQAEAAESELKRRSSKNINKYAYDGPMNSSTGIPKTIVENPNDLNASFQVNGIENGLSKGVILNVNHDSFNKEKKDSFADNPTFEMALNTLPVKTVNGNAEKASVPDEKLEMTIKRKIAFVLSFLPSILFVLCFAVILPCKDLPPPEPCVQEKWSIIMNDTTMTTYLNLQENLILTYENEGANIIASLDRNTGIELWNSSLKHVPDYINCDTLDFNGDGIIDCLAMDSSGYLYALNTSNGEILYELDVTDTSQLFSFPTILPDCKRENDSIIAFAISNSALQMGVTSDSFILSIPSCDTIPKQLMSWTRNSTTDLLYYCGEDTDAALIKIPQSEWCYPVDKENPATVSNMMRNVNLNQTHTLLTIDGMVIWAEGDISMISPEGDHLWKVSTGNHSTTRRFLKYGKFNGEEYQVALLSSDLYSNSLITTLNSTNGDTLSTEFISDAVISDAHYLKGKEKDFVITIIQKMKNDSTVMAELGLDGILTTVSSLLSNSKSNDTFNNLGYSTGPTIIQQIALLELGSQNIFHTFQEKEISLDTIKERVYPSVTSAVNIYENTLIVVVTSSFEFIRQTELRGISVVNWDVSSMLSTCPA